MRHSRMFVFALFILGIMAVSFFSSCDWLNDVLEGDKPKARCYRMCLKDHAFSKMIDGKCYCKKDKDWIIKIEMSDCDKLCPDSKYIIIKRECYCKEGENYIHKKKTEKPKQ